MSFTKRKAFTKFIVRKSQSTKLQKKHLTSYQKTESQRGKLSTVKQLNEEFKEVLAEKKKTYSEYREAKKCMQDYVKAKHNIDEFRRQEFVESKGAAGGKPESTPDGFDPVGDILEDFPFN
ncbi:MAG: hypothetical protein IJJ59_02680 [Pseudobutyrivibrio sp.]|uniref:hypothetical protein n=1 Tax=Pseudobutyrivibrio sp. TaxID=2014367 RepID=UPI0025E186D9|nr:hypothetical protein [Pseudobutyrivibrio sp.]MBQ6462211.1 hypothetical protein [Pseudobutyrivibrio sp.]